MLAEEAITKAVDAIVRSAQQNGAFNFTLTLLRVGGISESPDPFTAPTFEHDADPNDTAASELANLYAESLRHDDFLQFVVNLARCSQRETYKPFPFANITQTLSYADRARVTVEKVAITSAAARAADCNDVADVVEAAYPSEVVQNFDRLATDAEPFRAAGLAALALQRSLVAAWSRERRAYGSDSRLFRWPRYEVMEILCDGGVGLYGYRVYFSNGSHAEYLRFPHGASAVNLLLRDDVNYMVGAINDLKTEWRVGAKRLAEIGLPGRYNDLGDWKPLVYEGPTETLKAEAYAATTDRAAAGALLYIYLTAHHVVEFVVRTSIDLPIKGIASFGPENHPVKLWKCPEPDPPYRNVRVYDGWTTVAAPTAAAVQQALIRISLGLNRLAFVYDGDIVWRPKYGLDMEGRGLATPEDADLERFDEVLTSPASSAVLDYAIDWYNQGRNSSNPFTAYLCYFNAIESLVEAVLNGEEIGADLKLAKEPKRERLQRESDCIGQKHAELFQQEPAEFVRQAYFECIKSVTKRRRDVAALVWGEGHWVLHSLFDANGENPSLSDLRNDIAHARLSLIEPEDVQMVRSRLGEVARIAKGMILRLLLRKSPSESLKVWSGQHKIQFGFADPRNTLVTTTLAILPSSDWRIRPEWCD